MLNFIRLKDRSLDVKPPSNLIKADDYLAYASVEAIEKSAKAMTDAIVKKGQQHYQEQKDRGYQEGRQLAQRESLAKIYEIVGQAIDYMIHLESNLSDIVNEALKRIIDTYDDDALTSSIVRQGIERVCNEAHIKIIVCPEQTANVKAQVTALKDQYPMIEFIEVIGDSAMNRGDCRLETPVGIVDASIDVQLDALAKAFAEKNSIEGSDSDQKD